MTKQLTCIGCPMGCQLTAHLENGAVTAVEGNTCPQGEKYARRECVTPMRPLTGTVRLQDGRMLSVRTAGEIPKEQILAAAAALAGVHPAAPVAMGDVILADICGTGVDVIATRSIP